MCDERAAAKNIRPAFTKKCSVSSVETQAIKAAQGLGSNAMQSQMCAADGGASLMPAYRAVQCIFRRYELQ